MRETRSFWSRLAIGIGSVVLAGSLAMATPVFAQATPPATAPAASAPTIPAAAPKNTAPILINLSQPIGGVSQINATNGLAVYIAAWFRYLVGIVGLVATIAAIYGGFRYLMGAGSGDIKAGKDIMTNAVVGMILVLCSYAILYTVNPATVALKLPTITPIAKIPINTPSAPGLNRTGCNLDGDCMSGEKCLLHTGDINSSAPNAAPVASAGAPKEGFCTSGAANQPCRCSSTGCQMTTGYVTSQRRIVGEERNALMTLTRNSNNAGTGVFQCGGSGGNASMRCTYEDAQGGGPDWTCKNIVVRTADYNQYVRPTETRLERCLTDLASPDASSLPSGLARPDGSCSDGKVCLRWDRTSDISQGNGYCVSRTAATVGELCKCAGWGCANNIPGVSRKSVPCAAGLTCALAKVEGNDGLAEYYYCLPPVAPATPPTPATP